MIDNYTHVDSSVMYVVESIPGPAEESKEFTELLDNFHSQLTDHCKCQRQCREDRCSCLQLFGGDNYTANHGHHLQYLINNSKDFKTYPLIECNSLCLCSDTCGNRLVQKGPIDNLFIKKCDLAAKQLGLFTKTKIPKGAFICEYAGEIITKLEAMKRHVLNRSKCVMNYIYCLNEFSGAQVQQTFVDPSKFGNIGRYINHSCEPNCFIIPVRVDSPIPKLAIFSSGTIQAEEELTFDYGSGNMDSDEEISNDNIDLFQTEMSYMLKPSNNKLKERYEGTPMKSHVNGYLPLERLWAYLTIKQQLDARDAGEGDKDGTSPAKIALEMALKYEFVTPLTSLVVVKPNATTAVDAESVDDQSSGPIESPPLGVRSSMYSALAYEPAALGFGSNIIYFPHGAISGGYGFPAMGMQSSIDFLRNVDGVSYFDEPSYASGAYGFSAGISSWRHDRRYNSGLLSHYAPFAPNASILPTKSTPSTVRPVLSQYHLEDFPWVAALLNASTGQIAVPQTATLLQLTRDDEAPKASGGDEECARAIDGAVGRCVYLTRCRSARGLTAARYTSLHCAVSTRYAGVCCPKDEVCDDSIKLKTSKFN